MYFKSRTEAGQKLATEVAQYSSDDCIVVALNYGGVMVGEQIALVLGCPLRLLLSESVSLPGEPITIGAVSPDGSFVYNHTLSEGEIDEYYGEFHGYLDDQKREKFTKLNRLLSDGGVCEPKILKDRIVVLVSDGLKSGISLDAAMQFLKPIRVKKTIISTPIASVPAVDRMHILADEIHCLNVTENYISTAHYYDKEDKPNHDLAMKKIAEIEQNYQQKLA